MVAVRNISATTQYFGHYRLDPGKITDLPYNIARDLAKLPDYIADGIELMGDYKYDKGKKLCLGWSSPLHYADGYGSVAQEIASTFLSMGINLSIYPRDYDPSHKNMGGYTLDEWEEKAFVPRGIVERLGQSQDDCFYGFNMTWPREVDRSPFPRGIGYTMFETTHPPKEWAEPMNRCRRIVVPCKQNKMAFRTIGVKTPIDVVPLGVNPDMWQFVDRSKWERRGKPFTFLMSAGITHRKNPMAAARAFVKAFPYERDVQLVFKTRGSNTAAGFRSWQHELPRDPRIIIVCEESTPEQMVKWMQGAEAFVFPSRGEGFGLTPLQAMATGLPVIVSDNSGMSEYANPEYNIPIPCEEVPVPNATGGGFPDSWGYCGSWWEPDVNAIASAMRDVYCRYPEALDMGKKAAEWVRDNWTVAHTCRKLLDVVTSDLRV